LGPLAAGGGIVAVLYILFMIALLLAPLKIWSKTSQTVTLLRETNIYLKHITAATEETAKQVVLQARSPEGNT
jgi:hypothetical protein